MMNLYWKLDLVLRGADNGLLDPHEYIIDPLPNLVFARDWSVWIGDSACGSTVASQGASTAVNTITASTTPPDRSSETRTSYFSTETILG